MSKIRQCISQDPIQPFTLPAAQGPRIHRKIIVREMDLSLQNERRTMLASSNAEEIGASP